MRIVQKKKRDLHGGIATLGSASLGLTGVEDGSQLLREAAEKEELRVRNSPSRLGTGSVLLVSLAYVSTSRTRTQVLRERRDRRCRTRAGRSH